MRKFALHEYAAETIDYYVRQIPFFDRLAQQQPQQYQLLLNHSSIMELEPGEVLIEKGTIGEQFYSLVHGRLAIFQKRRPSDNALCELSPGQVLGVLSVINHEPRTATVVVSSVEGATVFCTDYSIFGEWNDLSQITLATKLLMFRDVVVQIRHMIAVYELEIPNLTLSEEFATLTPFVGKKDTMDELEYLSEQASALAWLLDRWNALKIPNVHLFDEAIIEKQLMALLHLQPQ